MRKTSLIILSLFSSGLLQQGAGYKVAAGIRNGRLGLRYCVDSAEHQLYISRDSATLNLIKKIDVGKRAGWHLLRSRDQARIHQ